MEIKIDDWDDKKFVLHLVSLYKERTPMNFRKKDLMEKIIQITGYDIKNAENFFQKLMKNGLELCSAYCRLPVEGIFYNITEFGIIRGFLNPKE